MTTETAAAFRMPVGKHRGRTLREINQAGDRGYLEWISAMWLARDDATIRQIVLIYVASTEKRNTIE